MYRSAGVAMAWNVFRFCTALRGLGSIMILLVLVIVGVTYYAVVLCNYGPALLAGGAITLTALAVLLLFHFLLAMLLWSYFSVVFTDPGSVPPNWNLEFDVETGETAPLASSEFNSQMNSQQSVARGSMGNPRVRYCRKCNQMKPPRCHHCSVCGRCVLKMDHHCVWVVNCVGALNYKYFLLFLFYTFLETTLVTVSLLPNFIAFFSDIDIPGSPAALATTFLTFVLNLAFSLSVLGFMVMHISLVSANTTTIEAYEKKTTPHWIYDLGRKRNFAQSVINSAALEGLSMHPLGNNFGGDYPILQYADDTLLIMPAEESQLVNLRNILGTYAASTGLKVNFAKSSIVPINVGPEKMNILANVLDCQVGVMPFTYLGLPLGTTRLTVDKFMPLLNRVEKRMMGIISLLTYAGRLVMVNSVLSALPTFYLCTLKVPAAVIHQLDEYRKHCLWDRGDINRKGGCLVAWKKACLPKEQGGLGIINVRIQNTALLLKHLHKFYNRG